MYNYYCNSGLVETKNGDYFNSVNLRFNKINMSELIYYFLSLDLSVLLFFFDICLIKSIIFLCLISFPTHIFYLVCLRLQNLKNYTHL